MSQFMKMVFEEKRFELLGRLQHQQLTPEQAKNVEATLSEIDYLDVLSEVHEKSNLQDMPFFDVDYEDGKPETYAGIVVHIGEKRIRIFSGNYQDDLTTAFLAFPVHSESSSLDHYAMDLAPKSTFSDEEGADSHE